MKNWIWIVIGVVVAYFIYSYYQKSEKQKTDTIKPKQSSLTDYNESYDIINWIAPTDIINKVLANTIKSSWVENILQKVVPESYSLNYMEEHVVKKAEAAPVQVSDSVKSALGNTDNTVWVDPALIRRGWDINSILG